MDPQKMFHTLQKAQDNIYSAIEILEQVKRESAAEKGTLAEKMPVNVQSVLDSLEIIADGEGQGTINGLMDLLLGASGSDFVDTGRDKKSSTPELEQPLEETPDLSTGPKSSIVQQESLKKFYNDSRKSMKEEVSGLSWDSIVEDERFGLLDDEDDYDGDYVGDVADTLESFGIDMSEDFIEDDSNYFDYEDDYDGPSWNGDLGDFTDDMFPEDLTMNEMRTRMEQQTGPVSGRPASTMSVAKSFGKMKDDIPGVDDFGDDIIYDDM